jgi:hypothetical protein
MTRGPSRFEAAVLVAFVAVAYASLAGLVLRTMLQGGLVTGGDGFLVADPLQYLTWLRQTGAHGAAENLYDLAPGPRTFVHPGMLLAGGLHALGVGMVAAYHVFKLPAALVLFAGTVLWVRRFLTGTGERRVALVLALFAASPLAALVAWTGAGGADLKFGADFVSGELWTLNWLWGYQFTAVAVGLVPLALLAHERGRTGWVAAAALLCTWLQPWQGATLLLTLVAAELATGRDVRRLVAPVVAGTLPAVYYAVLSVTDPAWELAAQANALPRWEPLVLAIGLLPFLPAVLALPLGPGPRAFGDVALRAWPLAGLVVYFLPVGTFPFHAWQGLALPLTVLAVLGTRRLPVLRRPAVALAAVALLVVPGTAYRVNELREAVQAGRQPFFLTADEHDALRHLDGLAEPGGVLAPVYSGLLVPAYTDRETYVGAGSWSPDFAQRTARADELFAGRLDPAAAGRFVRATGARFLYSDCAGRADLAPLVAGFTDPPRRFGCATVWRVRG